jgi:hypothetical protein
VIEYSPGFEMTIIRTKKGARLIMVSNELQSFSVNANNRVNGYLNLAHNIFEKYIYIEITIIYTAFLMFFMSLIS